MFVSLRGFSVVPDRETMEAIVIPVLLSAAEKLFTELSTIITLKKQHATVVRDVEEFRQSLQNDLLLVETKRKTLQDDQTWAIESLSKDLEDASMYLKNCRRQGWIQRYWDAKRTRSELNALRQKLSHNFQVKLFFTSLEMIIDKEKRTEQFHSKLVELTTVSATRSTNEIKDLLKPLTVGLKVQEAKFEQLRAEITALVTPSQTENYSSLDTEKFLQDILAGLAESAPSFEDDVQYYDPYTCGLMFDPVKCCDGRTYDRFSVFKYNAESHNKPLVILCPDESVRIRLFDKFWHERPDSIMRSRRNEYRTEALAIADADEFGEAIVHLDNVLQWDLEDSECYNKREKMREFYRQEALNLAGNGNRKEALDMLETVQKWSSWDREIFDTLEKIKRENSATRNHGLQQQLHTHNEIVSPNVWPTLEALVPMSSMDKQDGREGEKERKLRIIDEDNFQPNQLSETVWMSNKRKRERFVFMAKLAEQAERYDEMIESITKVAELDVELTAEERNLLHVGYKNVIGSRRASWRIMSSKEQKEESQKNEANVKRIKAYRHRVEEELSAICNDILSIIDEHLIPSSRTGESIVFYYKMKGDYYRYLTEFKIGNERKEVAAVSLEAYHWASNTAVTDLASTHPIRLGLALNFSESVFYYEILNRPERACQLAKQVFDEAIVDLDTLSEESYKENSTIIMQLLRDNLTLWTQDMEDAGEDQGK